MYIPVSVKKVDFAGNVVFRYVHETLENHILRQKSTLDEDHNKAYYLQVRNKSLKISQ